MSHFPRPADAIENPAALVPGLIVWHVYGIWPPQMSSTPEMIMKAPIQYRDHPDYSDTSCLGDAWICDTMHLKADLSPDTFFNGKVYTSHFFLSDANIGGGGYNDNYYFDNQKDAIAAVEYLKNCYQSKPSTIKSENDRHEDLISWSDMFYDDRDYLEDVE